MIGVDLAEHGVHGRDASFHVGTAHVDDVQEQIGVGDLLERGAKRVDELVRQAAHESDRVGDQHGLAAGQVEPARGGIEG